MRRRLSTIVIGIGVLAALSAATAGCTGAAAAPVPGVALYRGCQSCHGTSGEGNSQIGAPRIAGMPAWYVSAQVTRFQSGLRGQHPDDTEGLRMRAMSKQMLSAAEVDAVAGYVASLAPVTNPRTGAGDPAVGQANFAICITCHGDKGQGNQQVGAPPLAGQDDWYVARQLRKFRSRVRGTMPNDPVGPIMQSMSMTIDPANIDHLAAYVHSLPR